MCNVGQHRGAILTTITRLTRPSGSTRGPALRGTQRLRREERVMRLYEERPKVADPSAQAGVPCASAGLPEFLNARGWR